MDSSHAHEDFFPAILQDCIGALARKLGVPLGDRLAQHAADKQHEDVENDTDISPSSTPPNDRVANGPDRLTSFLPPFNFGSVVDGRIYRSAYPKEENFEFLRKLKLKTILTLVPEPIPASYTKFVNENGIRHLKVHIPANKGQIRIPTCQMSNALMIVMDRANHPMLIHCNKGKHRTGCVVGCFRKVLGESFDTVFKEYHAYADPKARILDECFIELFDKNTVMWKAREEKWDPDESDNDGVPQTHTQA